MSELATIATPAGEVRSLAAMLAIVPLFAGMSEEDVLDFASVFEPVELAAGEVLWRQATPVRGLHVLLAGEARVTRRLPGEREIEVARLGPGAVMGEIPLLGGGTHSATVRAESHCSLVFLPRKDFNARMQSGRQSALVLKRRIVGMVCARVRSDHTSLGAATRGTGATVGGDRRRPGRDPVVTTSTAYVSRLPFFARLGAEFVPPLLAGNEVLGFPARSVIHEEGEPPSHCYITLNGAVEDVLRRKGAATRVRFAGPGRAFCYLGLLDGGPATATSVARERSVVLAIDADAFHAMLRSGDHLGRAFAAAVEHDLMDMLRSVASPKAHLSAGGAGD